MVDESNHSRRRWLLMVAAGVAVVLGIGCLTLFLASGLPLLTVAQSRTTTDSSTSTTGANTGHPPFVHTLDVALDAGPIGEDVLWSALQPPLEDWLGAGNVRLRPLPAPGTTITRPTLALIVQSPRFVWSPLVAKSVISYSFLARDPARSYPWNTDVLRLSTGYSAPRSAHTPGQIHGHGEVTDDTTGLIPRAAYQAKLADRVVQDVVKAIVGYAQKSGPAPRSPNPPGTMPLTLDWSAPFEVLCGGKDMPYEVTYSGGSWGRTYNLPYDEDRSCEWVFTVRNGTPSEVDVQRLDPPSYVPSLTVFGEPECRLADEESWGSCSGRILLPGAAIQVRLRESFSNCRVTDMEGGGSSTELWQRVATGAAGEFSLPWSVSAFVENPSNENCPDRFPTANVQREVVDRIQAANAADGASGAPVRAVNVNYRHVINWEGVEGRYVVFTADLPDRTCVGLVKVDRPPAEYAETQQGSRYLGSKLPDRLIGQALRCLPPEAVARERALLLAVSEERSDGGRPGTVLTGIVADDQLHSVVVRAPDGTEIVAGSDSNGNGVVQGFVRDEAVVGLPELTVLLKQYSYSRDSPGVPLTVPVVPLGSPSTRDRP